MNVPTKIGIVVSSGRATLHELQTVYSIQDLENLLEILAVQAGNQRKLSKT